MNVSLEQLLKGKATKIKKNEYAQTEAYVTPFLERMSKYTDDFRCSVKLPEQITFDPNAQDITYNRVLIQAVLPETYTVDNHDEVVGMVYGIDVRKPVIKFYRGGLNRACTNLCVFSPDNLQIQELCSEKVPDYTYIDKLMSSQENFLDIIKMLKSHSINYSVPNIEKDLGKWIRNTIANHYDNGFSKAKLSVQNVIDAYKLIHEEDESPYYVKPGDDTTLFNVYNAFTELISNDNDKDIFNKCEKTLLFFKLIYLHYFNVIYRSS